MKFVEIPQLHGANVTLDIDRVISLGTNINGTNVITLDNDHVYAVTPETMKTIKKLLNCKTLEEVVI